MPLKRVQRLTSSRTSYSLWSPWRRGCGRSSASWSVRSDRLWRLRMRSGQRWTCWRNPISC